MTAAFDDEAREYDAILIVSFGGPEGRDDVMPFLENVLRGLPIKPESKQAIAQRYHDYGGVSPINGEVRKFIDALRNELAASDLDLPVYWGNRNWHPMLRDTVTQMAEDGVRNAIAFVTSMFSSYSGCRKYREDLFAAVDDLDNAPHIDKLRLGFNHPSFIEAVADRVGDALRKTDAARNDATVVLFTAHSLPEPMANACNYVQQLESACSLVAESLAVRDWKLVFQSNNASYGGPAWLGPDISDALRTVKSDGFRNAVVAPIGFVCDHMEVIIDLDVEAAAVANELELNMVRAATVGTHPAYVRMVRELIAERMRASPQRAALGSLGPNHDYCAADCCLSGRPGPPKPSLCSADDQIQ